MRRASALIAGLALLVAAGGFAQATLSYAYGKLELSQGGQWRELTVGSPLPAQAMVRLEAGSVAELASGELRITLSRPGTYFLPDLLSASQEASRWGLGAVVRNKVRLLFSAPLARESTPMAVRAEQMQGDGGLGWMDEEQDALVRGRAALGEERYADAARSFQEALELGDGSQRPTYLFYTGYALAMAGQGGAAQQALAQIEDPQGLPHYAEYVLLSARLAIEGQGYAQAERLLQGFLDSRPGHPAAQEALLLAAFCSRGLGRAEQAKARLQRVIELDGSTEPAAAARQALGRM